MIRLLRFYSISLALNSVDYFVFVVQYSNFSIYFSFALNVHESSCNGTTTTTTTITTTRINENGNKKKKTLADAILFSLFVVALRLFYRLAVTLSTVVFRCRFFYLSHHSFLPLSESLFPLCHTHTLFIYL